MSTESVEERNYYELLGVERDATEDVIRASYKELVRIFHPDSNFFSDIVSDKIDGGEADTFKLITEAYKTLTDARKRKEYDRTLTPVLPDWNHREPESISPAPRQGWTKASESSAMDKVKKSRTFGVVQRHGAEHEREVREVPSMFDLFQKRTGFWGKLLDLLGL